MDETTWQRWWKLHLRVVRGEPLESQEQAYYEAQRQRLEQAEDLRETAALREARARVNALSADQDQLQLRRQQLEAEMAAVETALSTQTRQLLGVED